ncbi:hypothetical protein ROZALSC1DRAFT_31140 [Rozella allomycis CSF55]|uniref:Pre-mRNA branch site protein p14 n=1 Tax=Rozella allomycis (strain CSF55) TaxID=988480 RepID=A0A075AUH9_ROZAC|nr:Pre-mRNA branch site protein p14 [Rozella allomycis CSF55]RKP17023.1 hypothetical protein ROZALSC1DRAFT_31140 [Rozella allomycis CSF55]|eukprot:EPZ33918.1 Pre-mRNA branch site protein p14 [Rozella allomycis CSF55]
MAMSQRSRGRLPPDANRILFVRYHFSHVSSRNLPFKISAEETYDLFGKYGAIRQIRVGTDKETRGTAFVVYEDIYDAKNACDHLSGFNVLGRYLIVLYFNPNKMSKKMSAEKKKEELEALKQKFGLGTVGNVAQ